MQLHHFLDTAGSAAVASRVAVFFNVQGVRWMVQMMPIVAFF